MDFPQSALGAAVTAFAVSETKIWARTMNSLLVSSDDGQTWSTIQIKPTIPLPGLGTVTVQLPTTGGNGNDVVSLAAFDSSAYVVFAPPDASGKNRTGNGSPVLIYDVSTNSWQAQLTNDNDGRGLGGRRFVKSHVLNCPGLRPVIGEGLRLFYGSAQGIQQALEVNADGTIQWDSVVLTDFAENPNPQYHIHSDIWDYHIGLEYCPPKEVAAWIACDGGVYKAVLPSPGIFERPNPQFNGLISEMKFVTYNSGLQTHNISSMVVIPKAGSPPLVAYSTHDNDGWWRKPDGTWHREEVLGDADFLYGDAENPDKAIVSRGLGQEQKPGHKDSSCVIGFGDDQSPSIFEISRVARQMEIIQTMNTETGPFPKLDAVILATIPLRDSQGNPLPTGASPAIPSGSNIALLRNTHFSDNPRRSRISVQGLDGGRC